MKRVIRADDLLGFVELMEKVYQHDDGAKAMAKSVRTYVTALADDPDYQRAFDETGWQASNLGLSGVRTGGSAV